MQLYVPSLNEIREHIPLFIQGTLVQGFCRKKIITLKHNDCDYNGNKRSALPHHQCYHFQGRSQYEANRGTWLSHLRFDAGSVLFKRSHPKDPEYLGGEFNHGYCLSPYFFLATALTLLREPVNTTNNLTVSSFFRSSH